MISETRVGRDPDQAWSARAGAAAVPRDWAGLPGKQGRPGPHPIYSNSSITYRRAGSRSRGAPWSDRRDLQKPLCVTARRDGHPIMFTPSPYRRHVFKESRFMNQSKRPLVG